jgi:hypothetical protein
MKYTYQENKISMKKACPQWFNFDCPPITAEDGSLIVRSTLNGFQWDETESYLTKKQIAKFVMASYKSFMKNILKENINPNWGKKDALFN